MYNELDSIYEGLYEYYINDYIIFEGILRRDYYECIGVLNEDGNKNFLKQLWEKIIQIIESIKQKISILIDKVTIKIDQSKIRSISNKLKKNKELIEKSCIPSIRKKIIVRLDTSELEKIKNDIKSNKNITIDNISTKNISEIDSYREKIKNSKQEFITIHNQIWDNGEEFDFSKRYIKVETLIDGVEKYLKSITENRKLKENIIKHYDSLKKQAKEKQKEYKKDKKDDDFKNAQNAYKLIFAMCQYDFQRIKFIIKEERDIFKNHIKLIKEIISWCKGMKPEENEELEKSLKAADDAFENAKNAIKDLERLNKKAEESLKRDKEFLNKIKDLDLEHEDLKKESKKMDDKLKDLYDRI